MTANTPEALRLADIIEQFGGASAYQAAAELRRLHAECEELRKSLALVQQHHATAWNRGYTMGMAANRQIAREAQAAVARDAWGNTQLTEALLKAEAECEKLRIVAENTVSLLEHMTGRVNLSASNYVACERVLVQARAALAARAAIKEQSNADTR